MNSLKKTIAISFLLLLLSAATLVVGDTPWNDVWTSAAERFQLGTSVWNPLLDERLPRLIVILCTGASLAVAGAVMQALFQNPLASPNVLGISCGGCLMVISVFILDLHLSFPFAIPVAAFLGSFLTLLFVYFLARSNGQVHMHDLILTGIAVSSLLFAIQAAILYALRDRWMLIQTLTEWEAGSTLDRDWKHVHMQLPLTMIGLIGCWLYHRELDILALGDEEAINLGVDIEKVRWRLFLCVALLTGGAIASVGMIAFFGLVLPHIVRHIQGPGNRNLIPLCMLIGSTTFCAMDLLLRLSHIRSLSIGNISAILGGVFFLYLIRSSRHSKAQYSC